MPDGSRRSRPHTQPLEAAFLEVDLMDELARLRNESTWESGRNTKTLVKYADLRVVLMALKARARIPEHTTEGRVSIQTRAGRINVHALNRTFDLPAGRLLALDQSVTHDVEALEDSGFLLTIALRKDGD